MIGQAYRAAAVAVFTFAAALAAGSGTVHTAPQIGGSRLLSSGARGVAFEIVVPPALVERSADGGVRIRIEGYGSISPPGAIDLPGRTFRVAIPPDGVADISASVLEEETLGRLDLARAYAERLVEGEQGLPATERYLPADPWKETGIPPLASAGAPSFMGRQRVLPVRINPVSIAADGTVRVARRIAVTVRHDAPRVPLGGARDAGAPLPKSWKRIYDELLVNPGDADVYRMPLLPLPAPEAPFEAGKRLKILVPETGLFVIRADSLISSGLSQGLSPGEIALKKYYYDAGASGLVRKVDVPILIVQDGAGSADVFDGGDLLYFYALGIKDDAEAGDGDALYAGRNVLWLEESTAGALMETGLARPAPPAEALTVHRAVKRERTDTAFMKNAVPGTFDYYFLKGYDVRQYALPVSINAPASSGTWDISIRVQGGDGIGLMHNLTFSLRNGSGTHAIGGGSFIGKEAKTMSFTGLPAAWLADGPNEILVVCDADYKHLINDFTLTYPGRFAVRSNVLEFAIDRQTEPLRIEISGFTVSSGILFECMDPRRPLYRMLAPSEFVPDGAAYKLVLDVDEDLSPRRFIVIGTGAGTVLPARLVSVDVPSNLARTEGSYHTLVISHGDFLQRIGEYVDWRRSRGYRILTADVQDVYDEFNGGIHHVSAIKRFIKYGFDHWGVEYVLLVGDASEDHRRLYAGAPGEKRGSPPDFVPSYTYVTSVTGTYDDETVSSDKWYAFLDGPPGADSYPDVFVGRFSVGRDVELRAIINKIYRMEDAQADETWRRNVVLFSDDAWSGGGSDYRYRSYEREFEYSTERCGVTVEETLPGGFGIRRLYLAPYTDPAHPNPDESGVAVYSRARDATRRTFTPALVRALNDGCLVHMFQGHANRAVLTTESAFSLQIYSDVDSLRTAIPFVFMGFGCHISDFAVWQELSYATYVGQEGDCMSEQLLFKPGGGAVSTYASDGFEYLSQNAVFVERLFESMFQRPPADSVAPGNEYTGAHWILGESITQAEIEQIDRTVFGLDQIMRYHLLGDPMLRVDPGPPLLRLEADWGSGFEPIDPGNLRAREGTNDVTLRLTASDVVAVGPPSLSVDGESWDDSLQISPIVDADKTFPRSYRADVRYTIDPADELLLWRVASPEGREVGRLEVPILTQLRLFYNGYLEILPGIPSPPSGTFTVTADFPAYLAAPPELYIDGIREEGIRFSVTDPADSLHWEASFERTLPSGKRVFTVRSGDFSRDIVFTVTGDELVLDVFNFPNPFSEETNIVYTLNLAADAGRIQIFNVSGILVKSIEIPPAGLLAASFISPHSVIWDGRDSAGDRVANGTYIYVFRVDRSGRSADATGKIVKLE